MIEPVDTPERLRKARHHLGLTQKSMADLLGVTIRSIQRMEAGDQPIEHRTDLAVRYLLMQSDSYYR